MKKLFAVLMFALFLSGCGTAAQNSEFWKHDSMYKNTDHMMYSWFGHKNPTTETGHVQMPNGPPVFKMVP